jgi:hypothetical protein
MKRIPRIVSFWMMVALISLTIFHPVQAATDPALMGQMAPPEISAPIPDISAISYCFALSNEPPGNLISKLVAAGYGEDNLYQALVDIVSHTNPSVSGVITSANLQALKAAPPSSQILTTQLKTVDTPNHTVEVCDNGTVQTEPMDGFGFSGAGFPSLVSQISGIGNTNFTHGTNTNPYLLVIEDTGIINTNYRVFGIAWGVTQPPSLYLPFVVR